MKRPWHCSICTCVSVYRDTRKGRGIVLYIRVCPSIETHGKAEALFYAYVCVHLWRHTERLWHCSMHACVSVYRGTRKAKTLFHTYVSVRLWRHTERSWHCFIHMCVSTSLCWNKAPLWLLGKCLLIGLLDLKNKTTAYSHWNPKLINTSYLDMYG